MGSELIEAIARARHENYVVQQRSRGQTARDNRSLLSWDELPEPLRQSNRRFAEGVQQKLDAVGAKAVRAEEGAEETFEFTVDEIETLARMEHDRWVGDLARDGWTSGSEKDPKRKKHPLLIGWEELSEADRDKDRDAVRSVPSVLSAAGYRIVRR